MTIFADALTLLDQADIPMQQHVDDLVAVIDRGRQQSVVDLLCAVLAVQQARGETGRHAHRALALWAEQAA